MSEDRDWHKRHYYVEESTTQNGGKRTVFVETLPAGSSVPPHFHKHFAETFEVPRGSVFIWSSDQPHTGEPDMQALEDSKTEIRPGQTTTIQPNIYHRFGTGDEETTIRITQTPGSPDFERMLMIMNGLGADGKLGEMTDDSILMAVVTEIGDVNNIGPIKKVLDKALEGKEAEAAELRAELLRKYDTEDGLKLLLTKPE